MYDLAIIGAGAAGLSAAIYAARAGLSFIVLEQDGWGGGQISSAHQVQNYPGAPEVSGAELGERFREQAVALGASIVYGEVLSVEDHGACKTVLLADDEPVEAKTVIAATGASPKPLVLPDGAALPASGISYCATCDGAFYADKDVLVIGGGDTAVEDTLYLSAICSSVTLALRRDKFRAAKTRVALLEARENVTVLRNTTLKAVLGDGKVEGVLLSVDGTEQARKADGIFAAIGIEPSVQYLNSLPLPFEGGYVAADETCRTPVPGLFVAGDIRKKRLRQVVTAAADGANAVAGVVDYLNALDAAAKR